MLCMCLWMCRRENHPACAGCPSFQMTACRLTDDLDRWNKHPLQRAMEKFVSSKSANYVNSPFSEDTPGRA